MLHQGQKKRQIVFGDPSLVKGQDEVAAAGVNQKI